MSVTLTGSLIDDGSSSDAKNTVRVATTAALVFATDFEAGDTIDGVVLAAGDRILVKDQAAGAENGIYVVQAAGAPFRSCDANSDSSVNAGMHVFVAEGTANADKQFQLTTNDPIVVGTTVLVFAEVSGGGGGVTDHTLLTNIGTNTHAQIDTHIADANLHFTEASIDHGSIAGLADVADHAYAFLHDGTRAMTGDSDHGGWSATGVNKIIGEGTIDGINTKELGLQSSPNTAIAFFASATHIDRHLTSIDGEIKYLMIGAGVTNQLTLHTGNLMIGLAFGATEINASPIVQVKDDGLAQVRAVQSKHTFLAQDVGDGLISANINYFGFLEESEFHVDGSGVPTTFNVNFFGHYNNPRLRSLTGGVGATNCLAEITSYTCRLGSVDTGWTVVKHVGLDYSSGHSGSGTVTTDIGVWIHGLNATNQYSIKSDDTTALLEHAGPANFAQYVDLGGIAAPANPAASTRRLFTDTGTGELSVQTSAGATVSLEADTDTTDHTLLTNIGTNTHAQIDTHIADATLHFTQASIDHTAILNIGTNTHAQIDTHIADATLHFTQASIDHGSIAGLADVADHAYAFLHDGTRAMTGNSDHGGFSATGIGEIVGDGSTTAGVVSLDIKSAASATVVSGVSRTALLVDTHLTSISDAVYIGAHVGASVTGQLTLDSTLGTTSIQGFSFGKSSNVVLLTGAPNLCAATAFASSHTYRADATGGAETMVYSGLLDSTKFSVQGATTNLVGNYVGHNSQPQYLRLSNGTGTGVATHLFASIPIMDTGWTISDHIAVDFVSKVAGGGVFTNEIGLYVHGLTATNQWSLKSDDATAMLEHAGPAQFDLYVDMTGVASVANPAAGTRRIFTNTGTGELSVQTSAGATVSLEADTDTTDHTLLTNIGTNTHAQIDTHIADATLHFTQASIDHTAILNIGTNTHAQIDTHIADATLHFTQASIDHGSIAGLGDDDHTQYILASGTRAFTGNVNLGAFYTDIDDIAVPANPAASVRRLFTNTATGELSVRTDAGVTVSLEAGGGLDANLATGTLKVLHGGTGKTTLANHGVLIGKDTTAVAVSAVGATGQYFQGRTGIDPTFLDLDIIDDTSPQLGADLDSNGFNIAIDESNYLYLHGPAGGSARSLSYVHSTGATTLRAGSYFDVHHNITSGSSERQTRLGYTGQDENFALVLHSDLTASAEQFRISNLPHVYMAETDTTPAAPALASSSGMYIYHKADKIVFVFNDAGTTRYKYLDMTGTGVTWVHTTTAP